jgi:hypothetical protein
MQSQRQRHTGTRRAAHARRQGPSTQKKLALSALGIILLALIASMGSWAAWTVSDSNSGNSFSTNTVLLDDNQGGQGGSATTSGTAIFNVANLEPGSAATTQCIGVDISGTATTSSLTLTAALGGAGQATLQGQLTMNTATLNTSGAVAVTPGTNTNSGSCTNYPAGGTNTNVGTQGATLSGWSTASPYTISSPVTNTWYKFTVSGLPAGDSSCATYCNQTITISLTWTLTTT